MKIIQITCVLFLLLVSSGCTEQTRVKLGYSEPARVKQGYSKQAWVEPKTCTHVSVGIIRWDMDNIEAAVDMKKTLELDEKNHQISVYKHDAAALSSSKWRYRLPLYATFSNKETVELKGSTPEVIRNDNRIAKESGIDYWAFLYYPPGLPYRQTLDTYLSTATQKNAPKFSLIIEVKKIFSNNSYSVQNDLANLMKNEHLFKDQYGKFTLYLYLDSKFRQQLNTSKEQTISTIESFFSGIASRDKYNLVVMTSDSGFGIKVVQLLKADALSAYAIGGALQGGTFEDLAKNNIQYLNRLNSMAQQGMKIVPTIMTGWDPRPRFEVYNKLAIQNIYPNKSWYHPATTEQLVTHFSNSIKWIKKHSQNIMSCVAIVYAWNEYTEGGWLAPTFELGTSRMDAVSNVLKTVNSEKNTPNKFPSLENKNHPY